MSDITFMRGYGFPKGSGMDYAGYGGVLVNQRQRRLSAIERIPYVPEPSVFAPIPALDGFGEGDAHVYGKRTASYGDSSTNLAVQALQTLGLLGAAYSQAQLVSVFTNWAVAHGFTAAKYGTKWDDYAIEAMVREAQKLEYRAARGRRFGSEYDFRVARQQALGDMVLPTLDTETGEWSNTPPSRLPMNPIGIVAGLALAWALFGR